MTSVQVDSVTAGYSGDPVLVDLNLAVASGELVAVLGSSGSGKTTLLRVLAGFIRPSAGSVIFGTRTVSGPHAWVAPEDRRLGIVPQEGALFPHLDVRRNVGFGLDRSRESSRRINEVLEMVSMQDFAVARPQELSGGQQQRVALARALAPLPDLLLLDEPFSALDASMRVSLRAEVRDLLKSLGTTAIMVTHDQEEALSIADKVAVMRDGRLVQMASPVQLYQHPADIAVARFVGDAVELPAVWNGADSVDTPLGPVAVRGSSSTGAGAVIAVLRPEQLVVADPHAIDDVRLGGGVGVVSSVSYHGHNSLLQVRLASGQDIAVRVSGESAVAAGGRVRILVTGAASIYPATTDLAHG
jgi:iron(III) transport system ATP-binding protein